jgi:L-fucose mutarotase/ribose pyranase (RbsD/FucU family)
MRTRTRKLYICIAVSVFVCFSMKAADTQVPQSWQQIVAERLPLYGHRNWIVIADSAYPAQSRAGIETVVSGAEQTDVLKQVLSALAASRHIRPIVYTDRELRFVPEQDAPGIGNYRQQLNALLKGMAVQLLPHEEIISKLDQAGQTFRVLIIKTNLTIPYTSVFLQLDCAYWSAEAEQKLRGAMASQSGTSK